MRKVSILGTEYSILEEKLGSDTIDGYCDYTSKEIHIRSDNYNELGNFEKLQKKQLRHEIIHAFYPKVDYSLISNIHNNLDTKKLWLTGLPFSFLKS